MGDTETDVKFILIVDDNATERALYRAWIEDTFPDYENIVCEEADNVVAAREMLEMLTPDCVLLDYRMLGGDGFKFLSVLEARYGTVPPTVIFMTGYGDESIKERAMSNGAVAYMAKETLQANDLTQAVARVMSRNKGNMA